MSERTFVPSHGARPAARAIRAWIEDILIAAQTTPPITAAQQVAPALDDPELSD
jgi:hypothetical protein